MIGKTGTSQVTRKADFALFASYAPFPNPEYAVVAILEQAGFGGDAAAPAVRRFYDVLFGNTELPTAPLAEERNLDVVGLTDFDLSFSIPEIVIDPTQFDEAPATPTPAPDAGTNAPPAATTTPATTTPPTTAQATTSSAAQSTTTTTTAPGGGVTTVAPPASSDPNPPTSTTQSPTTTVATTATTQSGSDP